MRRVVLVLLLVSAWPWPARAEDVNAAREHYRRGTTLFDLGRYPEAAKEYEAAFEAKDDPALLFNLGQAKRLAGDADGAVRSYRAYLRRVPDSRRRVEVEARIRELQEILDREKQNKQAPPDGVLSPDSTRATRPEPARSTTPEPQPAAPAPTAEPAKTPTPTPSAARLTAAPPAQPSRKPPLYKRWWLWTAVGAVVVTGVVVGVGVGLTRDSFNPSFGRVGPGALEVAR